MVKSVIELSGVNRDDIDKIDDGYLCKHPCFSSLEKFGREIDIIQEIVDNCRRVYGYPKGILKVVEEECDTTPSERGMNYMILNSLVEY